MMCSDCQIGLGLSLNYEYIVPKVIIYTLKKHKTSEVPILSAQSRWGKKWIELNTLTAEFVYNHMKKLIICVFNLKLMPSQLQADCKRCDANLHQSAVRGKSL